MKQRFFFLIAWTVLLVMTTAGGTAYWYHLNGAKAAMLPLTSLLSGQPAVPGKTSPMELVLARSYLCGLRDEERKPLAGESLEKTISNYVGWEIIGYEEGRLMLLKRENDIAPICKENGYFGLNEEDVLTLFNGMPKDKQVIQTFYPINTARMEASMAKEEIEALRKGIRIRDLAEYNSVLSTFGSFQEDGADHEGH